MQPRYNIVYSDHPRNYTQPHRPIAGTLQWKGVSNSYYVYSKRGNSLIIQRTTRFGNKFSMHREMWRTIE
jgi:hypothetical protein